MQLTRWLFSALVGCCLLTGRQLTPSTGSPAADDCYSIAAVSSALQFLHGTGVANSAEAKRYLYPLLPLGDRVSIAVLKIYGTNDLVQTENAEAYLTAVRNAFSSQSSVVDKSDTEPRVTLFVLEYLKEKEVARPEIQKRIKYLEGCVGSFSCSSQSEYEFFKSRH